MSTDTVGSEHADRYQPVRALILGAGASRPDDGEDSETPSCLLADPLGGRVMDWIVSALEAVGVKEIVFVGGFRIETIGKKYPNFEYIYNPEWKTSGVLQSLYCSRGRLTDPLLISYADIVYRPEACVKLIEHLSDFISVAIDTTWRNREKKPPENGVVRKNLVKVSDNRVTDIGFLEVTDDIAGEFVGLTYFGPKVMPQLNLFANEVYPALDGMPFEQAKKINLGYMTDLLRYFIRRGVEIKAVDIGPEWAEMDEIESLAKFVLGTKSETLDRIAPLVRNAKFCSQEVFTVDMWKTEREDILEKIHHRFSPGAVAVRSSTLAEDCWSSSFAGAFKTILNVEADNVRSVAEAIDRVISSYKEAGHDHCPGNQILVQEMVRDVVMSGVVFTRDINSGAPYYVVNYDNISRRTDTVTSGDVHSLRTMLVSRSYSGSMKNRYIEKLLKIVRDIEHVTGCYALDIEFAINENKDIYVLQVRPITVLPRQDIFQEISASQEIESIKEFLRQRFRRVPFLYGETTVLGDMPDWNPAEMIGTRPRPLAFSLYHYLITDSAWRIARSRIGYNHPQPASLMVMLSGHPYVDVRCSFNSFLPAPISGELSEKLVNHYIEHLKENPDKHDKIEFEVCLTCLDFSFESQVVRLMQSGFSKQEVEELRKELLKITDNVVSGRIEPISKLADDIHTLNRRRLEALSPSSSTYGIPCVISQLIDDVITYGTIPFSILARYAFIANSLLRSLVFRNILTEDEQYTFLQSIESVATALVHDMDAVQAGKLSLQEFLKAYGHLRPGTYDITALRYDEAPDAYFMVDKMLDAGFVEKRTDDGRKEFELPVKKRHEIQAIIEETGFTFTVDEMFGFMRDAISLREWAKFEFTRTVSDILVLLTTLGEKHDLSREDLSFLNIESVRQLGIDVQPKGIRERMMVEIERGRASFEQSHIIRLPHLITSIEDLDVIDLKSSRPNFVTSKEVTGQLVLVNKQTEPHSLGGKIALIEGADPGFDWVFACGITGLITKYGGAASHMTIRAAEFGMPAAIGCGEALFDQLMKATRVKLDCSGKAIRVL